MARIRGSRRVTSWTVAFSTLGLLGSVTHPTGYPLYLMYLRVVQSLPGANAAHTAALATAIIGAGSIVMLRAACRAWGARLIAATFACTIIAAAPVVVEPNTEAEVFALNNLVAATILWLAANQGPVRAFGVRACSAWSPARGVRSVDRSRAGCRKLASKC